MKSSKWSKISPSVNLVSIQNAPKVLYEFVDPDNVMTYVCNGSAQMMMHGRFYSIEAGDLFVIPPWGPHIFRDISPSMRLYVFTFDLYYNEAVSALSREERLQRKLPVDEEELVFLHDYSIVKLNAQQHKWFSECFMQMLSNFHNSTEDNTLAIKAAAMQILNLYVAGQKRKAEPISDAMEISIWKSIEMAVAYIHDNYHRYELTNEEIACHVGISPNYLTSLFTKFVGVSLHKYINGLRISIVNSMLVDCKENSTLTQIADSTGFGSLQSFCKVYKREMGMSASDFRSRNYRKGHWY
jgi:YesN/AraC family two-component response regulator